MANNNQIYKMSNAGGFKSLNRYYDMLAGNTTWNPWEPEGAFDSLATVTVPSGGLASITFAAIPNTYKHLQLRGLARSTIAGAGNNIGMYMQFNSDTTSNYNWHELAGNGSITLAYGQADTGMNMNPHCPRAGDTASSFAGNVIDVLDYTNTNKNTTVRALAANDTNGGGWVHLTSGLWRSTAAVTSIVLSLESSNFAQYSQFTLYGVK
jgi:hypothetical protein